MLVIVPMIISIFWRSRASACDYMAQGGLVLMALVLPFTTLLQTNLGKLFSLLFGMMLLWGAWRMFYFDIVTGNDPGPGIVYLVAPVFLATYGTVLFAFRKLIVYLINRLRKNPQKVSL